MNINQIAMFEIDYSSDTRSRSFGHNMWTHRYSHPGSCGCAFSKVFDCTGTNDRSRLWSIPLSNMEKAFEIGNLVVYENLNGYKRQSVLHSLLWLTNPRPSWETALNF
jgi:hypothetical protein